MLDFRILTFLTVCETMHFTRAAELLHITQPAVSHQIHALEEQYGAALFSYEGKKLLLTDAGKLLRETALTMRHDADLLKARIKHLCDGQVKSFLWCHLNGRGICYAVSSGTVFTKSSEGSDTDAGS